MLYLYLDATIEPLPVGVNRQTFVVVWSGSNTNYGRIDFGDGKSSRIWFGDSGARVISHSYPCSETSTSWFPVLITDAGSVDDSFIQEDTVPNGSCPSPGSAEAAAFHLPDTDVGVALPAGT